MLAPILIFVLNNVLAVIAAEAIITILFSNAEVWRRWLARCMTFMLIISADLLITGSLGLLKPVYVLMLMSILTLLSLTASKLIQPAAAAPEPLLLQPPTVVDYVQRWLASVLFALFAVGLVARRVYQPPKWFNDDFAYHATNVVQWIHDGRLTLGAFNDHAYWPLNTALLPLWLVLPFGADGLAVWNAAPWLTLSTIALVGIARVQKMDWSVGLMASAMAAASPANAWMLGTFSAADFSGPVMLLAAIAFLAPVQASQRQAMSTSNLKDITSRTNAIFAGLATGFAVGGKIPFLIAAFILGIWILTDRSTSFIERIYRAALYALGVTITGSYWYIRNWLFTGNPLFPGKVGPFEGPMTFENSQPTLFQWMVSSPPSSAWYDLPAAYIGSWSYGLALLALIAVGSAIWQCIKARSRSILGLLIIMFLGLLVTHPFMPVSGPYPFDAEHPHFVPRYITGVFLIGMALATTLLGAKGPSKWIWWALATTSCAAAWSGSTKTFFALIVVASLLFFFGYRLLHVAARLIASRPTARTAIVALCAFGAAILFPYNQKLVDRYIHESYSNVPVGNGWRELEKLPSGSRIAWFDNYNWEYYPMYGRRWQLIPIPVNLDGTSFRPVHESWRDKPKSSVSGDELLSNLVGAAVQYVFVSKNRSDTWPPQYKQLERPTGVTRVYDDGYNAIFKIH